MLLDSLALPYKKDTQEDRSCWDSRGTFRQMVG